MTPWKRKAEFGIVIFFCFAVGLMDALTGAIHFSSCSGHYISSLMIGQGICWLIVSLFEIAKVCIPRRSRRNSFCYYFMHGQSSFSIFRDVFYFLPSTGIQSAAVAIALLANLNLSIDLWRNEAPSCEDRILIVVSWITVVFSYVATLIVIWLVWVLMPYRAISGD